MNKKLWLRLGICVVLLGGGVGGFYYLWYAPTIKEDAEQAIQIDQRKRALAELAQSTAGIDDFNRKFKELTEAVRFFESKLPKEKEVETVLDQVWKIAEANSLQAKSIRSGKTERTANYSQQQIDMELAGDFNGFYLFMQQLERLPRLTRIEGMTLSKISDHDGAMQARLILTIFFEPAGT
ncbi:MAG TPA: type 4a pilus biogenesis protein PilO [Tepidisphaeraceae bacterium]|nr:type 4a pilus biogenesis protein PilO [Tepidisphaeraceae bacterium]